MRHRAPRRLFGLLSPRVLGAVRRPGWLVYAIASLIVVVAGGAFAAAGLFRGGGDEALASNTPATERIGTQAPPSRGSDRDPLASQSADPSERPAADGQGPTGSTGETELPDPTPQGVDSSTPSTSPDPADTTAGDAASGTPSGSGSSSSPSSGSSSPQSSQQPSDRPDEDDDDDSSDDGDDSDDDSGDDDAPQTSILEGPIGKLVPSFEFTADEKATFTCSVDGGSWSSCSSGVTVDGLSAGWHTFAVRATDSAGNTDPSPDTWDFKTVGG